MNTKIKHIILFLLAFNLSKAQTTIKLTQLEKASGTGSTVVTNSVGALHYVPNATLTISGQSLSISRGNTITIPNNITQTVSATSTTTTPSEAAVYNYVTSKSSTITLLPSDIATTSTVGVTVFTMTVEANKTYIIRGKVGIGCDNTGGVRFASTIPSGSGQGLIIGRTSSNTALAASGFVSTGAWSQPLNTINSTAGSGIMEQMITVGVTGGTYSLLISPNTNGQTATIYTATTYFEIIKL